MSIFFIGMSSHTLDETKSVLQRLRREHSAVLDHFWISDVTAPSKYDTATGDEFEFAVKSIFLIQWNKEGGSEFIPAIPALLYSVFGEKNLLVFDLDRELVRADR